jgi:tetratricopeptide (TPR) repeat protein
MKTRRPVSVLTVLVSTLVGGSCLFGQAEVSKVPQALFYTEQAFSGLQDEKKEPTEYEILNGRAIRMIAAGKWTEVNRFLNQAVALEPDLPDAYLNFGRSLVAQRKYAGAEKAFMKAQEVDPDHAPTWYAYAKLMVLKGEPVIAFESANKAVVLSDSKEWRYLLLLGELSANRGDALGTEIAFDGAIDALTRQFNQIDNAIHVEEQKDEIKEIIHETDVIRSPGGGSQEVPVVRFETDKKMAPAEWLDARDELERRIAEVRARKAQVMATLEEP